MFTSRVLHGFILTASALTGLACGDYSRSTGPALSKAELLQPTLRIQSSFATLTSGTKARAVKWGAAHSRVEQSVSALVGPDGGALSLPGSDFTLSIPSGALSAPTMITVVAKAGSHVAYEMLPHGLHFSKPVTAVQGLQNTAINGSASANSIRTGFLPEGSDSIDANDSASPSELEAGTTYYYGAANVAGSHVWIINHFSRYILISNVWVLVGDGE
jgi:ZU5 domain